MTCENSLPDDEADLYPYPFPANSGGGITTAWQPEPRASAQEADENGSRPDYFLPCDPDRSPILGPVPGKGAAGKALALPPSPPTLTPGQFCQIGLLFLSL